MPVERSAGAVIFRLQPTHPSSRPDKSGRAPEGQKPLFLLLYYSSISHRASKNYWDLPKGHIEKGEKLEDTAKRETREETGLKNLEIVEGFKETIKYFFKFEGKNILKFVTFFLIKTDEKEVKISGEHVGFEWLPFTEALEQLTFKNAKEILKKANDFLSGKSIQNSN